MTPQQQKDPPAIVLDSNVVLDWLVFGNPVGAAVEAALTAHTVRWIVSDTMREELGFVLAGGTLARWAPDPDKVWQHWHRWAVPVPEVPPMDAALRLRCRDRDDQKFIDLATGHGARWLLSRDKAVLALRKRAAALGLTICTPEQWASRPAD